MNLPLFIARRYLISKKSHNAINIISGVALGGIAIGTMALIIVLSSFNGLSDLIKSLYNSFDADITITARKGKTFQPIGAKFDSIRHVNGVKYFNEVMQDKAMLIYNDRQSGAILKGVSSSFEPMTQFDTLVHDGSFILHKSGQNYGIFGEGVAHRIGVGLTNADYYSVTCYAPKRGLFAVANPADAVTEMHLFPAGTFSINDDFDSHYVIVSLDFARALFDYHNSSASSVEIGLAKTADAGKVKSEIRKILGTDFLVKDRYEQNELIFKTLKSEKLWTFIILVFILIIATFNIVGSLSMLMLDKEKDMDTILKMGADLSLVRKIFLYEGALITLIGACTGILLGTIICLIQIYFKVIPIGQGFVIDSYPVKLQATDYLYVFLCTVAIGIVASWYPVRTFATPRPMKERK